MTLIYSTESKINSDLDGIIKFLYDQNKDFYNRNNDAFYNEVLYVNGTQNFGEWGPASVTILPYYWQDNYQYSWCSIDDPYAFISYHFVQHSLFIKNYSIKSRTVENIDMPKGWVMYGSNDNIHWNVIDEKKHREELLNTNTIYTYKVDFPGLYRNFKLIITENSIKEKNVFSFSKIELFGDLYLGIQNIIRNTFFIKNKNDYIKCYISVLFLLFI